MTLSLHRCQIILSKLWSTLTSDNATLASMSCVPVLTQLFGLMYFSTINFKLSRMNSIHGEMFNEGGTLPQKTATYPLKADPDRPTRFNVQPTPYLP